MDDYTLAPSSGIIIHNNGSVTRTKLMKDTNKLLDVSNSGFQTGNGNSHLANETIVVIEIGSRSYLNTEDCQADNANKML